MRHGGHGDGCVSMRSVKTTKRNGQRSPARRNARRGIKSNTARVAAGATPPLRVDLKGFVPARRRRPSGRPPRDFSARREILRAASYVFVRKGVAEATVEDILDATGMGRATFYRAFRSKEDVFAALNDQFQAAVGATFREAGVGVGGNPQTLAELIDSQVGVAFETGDLFDLIAIESTKRGSALEAARDRAAEVITEVAHREQRLEGSDLADPLLIRAYMGAFDEIIRYQLRHSKRGPEDRARAVRVMLDVVRAITEGVHPRRGAATKGKPAVRRRSAARA